MNGFALVQVYEDPWPGARELICRQDDVDALRFHRLHLVAAHEWQRLGQSVPEPVLEDQRLAAASLLASEHLLSQIRRHVTGEIVVLKGPEVAAYYPDPTLRPMNDLDLLFSDPEVALAELLEADWEVAEDDWVLPRHEYESKHHLVPLRWPPLGIVLEVHRRPNWPSWMASPSLESLRAHLEPSRTGIDGLLAPEPAAHALLLTAHAFTTRPYAAARDLLDIALLRAATRPGEIAELAARWQMSTVWSFTEDLVDDLFFNRPLSGTTRRVITSPIRQLRVPSRAEDLLDSFLSRFVVLTPGKAVREVTKRASRFPRDIGRDVVRDTRPWRP